MAQRLAGLSLVGENSSRRWLGIAIRYPSPDGCTISPVAHGRAGQSREGVLALVGCDARYEFTASRENLPLLSGRLSTMLCHMSRSTGGVRTTVERAEATGKRGEYPS